MILLKKRQIISLSLIAMIVVAGYLQYENRSREDIETTKDTTGQKVYVSANSVQSKKDFFARAKLERDISVDRNKEALEDISKDQNASEEIRDNAYKEMMKLISNKEKETKVEMMVEEIGIKNVLAILKDDTLDIIVKSPKLTSNLATKIATIGKEYANVSIDNICVKNKN
ncbi:MAG: SpoIIIAH-like family protein [Clostridiales bacterium]|nr:SpoIIIAH-like family protein [Clostridiales bacterium]